MGHSLCFEKQDGAWVNQSMGTARFHLETREGVGTSEEETFLLTDVMDHTLCVYDRQGQLCRVEYPNGQKLRFAYNENGLERITTPVGNVLEVKCGGHILQITDETGRRTQYRCDGDYMTDVVHTDEGITHYEYDENGHITAVTDQNGSRYLENEYDASTALVTDRNGDLKNQYQYDVFGIGLDAVEELPNRIRYTGQQYDQQTEQYYLRARYYNPVLGRFLQEDVYQNDGLNMYAYCRNNPVVYYDPSGYNSCKEL